MTKGSESLSSRKKGRQTSAGIFGRGSLAIPVWSLVLLAISFLPGSANDIAGSVGSGAGAVVGNWEGMWHDDAMYRGELSAQVIDEGKGSFRAALTVRPWTLKGEMRGERKGDKVGFKGTMDAGSGQASAYGGIYDFAGEIVGGKFTGRYQDRPGERGSEQKRTFRPGSFEMKRVVKKSPTLGAKPPDGAIVLFDGKDMSKWVTKKGGANPWKLVDGAMEIVPGKGDVMTKDQFGDFKLHLEFCVPLMEEARGQGRGNSGVFLPGNCEEVQILDSFGEKPDNGSCGAIYAQKPPDVNACLPPGEWQTYDIVCLAPRFDEKGNMAQKTILTVHHNGALIHDRFPAKRKTGTRHGDHFRGILLQDHGNLVRFRNIWLMPLESK